MKTFQDYIKDLQEMPYVNSYLTLNRIDKEIEDHDKLHLAAKTKRIGNNSFSYLSDSNLRVYFRKNSKGLPEELNYIDQNNVQVLAYKRNGTVQTIVDHMIYHIKKYDELKTDSNQSPGAKHLWINFIRSSPIGIKFETIIGNKKIQLDKNNIDDLEEKIWSTKIRSANIQVRAYVD
jgi:hypothetical protein